MRYFIYLLLVTTRLILLFKYFTAPKTEIDKQPYVSNIVEDINKPEEKSVPENAVVNRSSLLEKISPSKTLATTYFAFQTFNNCGPSALAIDLSFYGINETQESLGRQLRPYQVPNGINDDKSVSLDELAEKAREYAFTVYHRPNGNIDTLKLFISNDMPVIAKTWLKEDEDVGHFRVVKGYDENKQELIQDDSYDGKNLSFGYKKFNAIWDKFNFEYLVLVPKDKEEIAKTILDENFDEQASWNLAVKNARNSLEDNPNDVINGLNLLVSLYRIGDYQGVVDVFEKIETILPPRTLWYHLEPLRAYYELGNYNKVFSLSDKILNGGNRAYSEVYIIRGDIYFNQQKYKEAKKEYEEAVYYNIYRKEANDALKKVNDILSTTN